MAPSAVYSHAFVRRQAGSLRWLLRSPSRRQCRWQSSESKVPRDEDPVPVPNTVATLPLWQRLGPLTRAAEAYARAQRRRPYVTQLCSTLVIYLCADISAQHISQKDYDAKRTGRSLAIGAIFAIPGYNWCVRELLPVAATRLAVLHCC